MRRYVRDDKIEDREPQRREDRGEGQGRQDPRFQERGRDDRQNPALDNEPTLEAIHAISGGDTLVEDIVYG